MQGLFINYRRPKSKKEVVEAIKASPDSVSLEATSIFGKEYEGPITEMPENTNVACVGPDPYTRRDFYLTIVRNKNTFKIK